MDIQETSQSPAARAEPRQIDSGTIIASAVVVVLNLAVGALLLCHRIPFHQRVVVDNLAQCAGPFIVAVWCFFGIARLKLLCKKRGIVNAPKMVSAVCLSFGALCFSIGQSIWTYYELILHIQTPFPSLADAGYLAAYPFLFWGVLSLPAQSLSVNKRAVVFFEGLMLMTGIATFSWFYVLGPTLLQTGESMTARLIGTAYPLSDIVMICCVLLVFVRTGRVKFHALGLALAVGFLSVVVSDTVFDLQTLHNVYATGHLIDIGWPFGYMLIAVAGYGTLSPAAYQALISDNVNRSRYASVMFGELSTLNEVRPLVVQYGVVVAVAALLWNAFRSTGDHRLHAGVCIGATLIIGLLLMRQFFMILENKALTKQLLAFSENLEKVVEKRTSELAVKTDQLVALQALTTAINETLDEGNVLNAAVEHARAAFDAEAVAIWLFDSKKKKDYGVPNFCVGMGEESDAFRKASLFEITDVFVPTVVHVGEADDHVLNLEYIQAPLKSRGILLGKVGVLRCVTKYTESEVQLLDSICMHVATAFDNANQFWNARDAADRDPVTGLLNHRAIHEYLDTAIELEAAFDEPLAVILADIDNFHLFNDTYGHPVGDDVLSKVGQLLDSALTAPCKIGRYRGDEFILVLPEYNAERSIELAKELQALMAGLDLRYGDDDRSIPTSMSFGVATFPVDSTDRQDLLVTASSNLRTAKNSEDHIVTLSDLQRAHRELRVSSSFRMLDGMVTAVDNKDSYTRKHSEDVTDFALWIAEELEMEDELKQILRAGGLLHDVGKIGIPDEILRKPGRLTEEEYTIMKQHPTLGALIVGGVNGMDNIIDIVRHHHEHWDGCGYPDCLAGNDIPFNARLVAVADAMSAMTTDRPYRKGMPIEIALGRIQEGMGTQFDPLLADVFIRVVEKKLGKKPQLEQRAKLPKAA